MSVASIPLVESNLRRGYKHTEVGVIPTDWHMSTVGSEFSVQLGKMLDSEKNVGDLCFYLGNRSVQWGRIELEAIGLMRIGSHEKARFRLEPGDLLVCEGGEVGRAAIWNAPITECYYQKAIHRLRPKQRFDVRFMLQTLMSWVSTGFLSNFSSQTSIAHLTKEKFECIPLLTPPLTEQRAIAEALGDMDALIAAQQKLIAKKRAIKTATMQRLLTGKQRLPGFGEGCGYKQTEIGVIPQDWAVQELDQIVDPQRSICYGIVQTGPALPNGIPCVRVVDLVSGEIKVDSLLTTSEVISRSYARTVLQLGDLVLALRGKIGQVAIVRSSLVGANLTRGVALLAIASPFATEYFAHYLSSSQGERRLTASLNGSALKEITIGTLKSFAVPFPPPAEQKAIAQVLTDMDSEITALEKRLAKTKDIKQGMMQELLTGRTRLI